MIIVHTLPARYTKPQCLNQQQLDPQCCRLQLWTKTKEKTQSLSTLLKQVRTEAENVTTWFMPYTEQFCDGDLSWHTSQLLMTTFSCRAWQRRHLVGFGFCLSCFVVVVVIIIIILKLYYTELVRTESHSHSLDGYRGFTSKSLVQNHHRQ